MKRHEKLQPLSRQHHNGLLAALLLKKGIAKAAKADVMAAFIIDFWNKDLKQHFEREEQILIPALKNTSFDKNLNNQLLQEHALIRSYIDSLKNNTDDISTIDAFTQLLEKHIRFEERIYFREAEKVLSEEQLQKIGEQLKDEEEKNCMNYPIRFWE
jgi:hemerythrin-like domain-containing protein